MFSGVYLDMLEDITKNHLHFQSLGVKISKDHHLDLRDLRMEVWFSFWKFPIDMVVCGVLCHGQCWKICLPIPVNQVYSFTVLQSQETDKVKIKWESYSYGYTRKFIWVSPLTFQNHHFCFILPSVQRCFLTSQEIGHERHQKKMARHQVLARSGFSGTLLDESSQRAWAKREVLPCAGHTCGSFFCWCDDTVVVGFQQIGKRGDKSELLPFVAIWHSRHMQVPLETLCTSPNDLTQLGHLFPTACGLCGWGRPAVSLHGALTDALFRGSRACEHETSAQLHIDRVIGLPNHFPYEGL